MYEKYWTMLSRGLLSARNCWVQRNSLLRRREKRNSPSLFGSSRVSWSTFYACTSLFSNDSAAIEKEITGLRSSLATVNGMLEVSKGIEGLAPRVQQLEADGQELDGRINEKMKMANKIDDLFNRVRPFQTGGQGQMGRDSLSDVLSGMPKDLFPDTPEPAKEVTRKAGSR